MWVRVQISTLRVDVTDGYSRSNGHVGKRISHTTASQRVLEFGAHKPISFTRILEDQKVDLEHGHVEDDGYGNQTHRPGIKVPDK